MLDIGTLQVYPCAAVLHCMPTALQADTPGTIAEGLWPRGGVLQLLLHLYGVETPNRGILRKS